MEEEANHEILNSKSSKVVANFDKNPKLWSGPHSLWATGGGRGGAKGRGGPGGLGGCAGGGGGGRRGQAEDRWQLGWQ